MSGLVLTFLFWRPPAEMNVHDWLEFRLRAAANCEGSRGTGCCFPERLSKRLRNEHVTRHNEGADSLARHSMAKQAQIFLVLSLFSE